MNNIFDQSSSSENEFEPQKPLKKFWSYIKSLKKDSCGVSPLKRDGVLVSESKQKATILNSQYSSVFTKESSNEIPELEDSPHPSLPPLKVSLPGVLKLLNNLKIDKAAGPDKIHPRFLKTVSEEVAPLLVHLFQKSIDTGHVPTQWKCANITPVFKKGDKSDPANYRPVSLTSVPCKLLEHIISKHIMTHLESNNILTDSQHGFRAKRSCETQLLNFTQELLEGLANGDQYHVNIMDFSKAFDKVPHSRLLKKIEYYGIGENIHDWIKSFLSNRSQKVVVDGESSPSCDVDSGVPQGTVMGPILFLLFINDLPPTISSPCKLFADDLIVYRKITKQTDCNILQYDMNKLAKWERVWGMKFHPDKCETIIVSRKRKPHKHIYLLSGHPLKHVDEAKYLGVNISEDLDWSPHIRKVIIKANKSLGFIKRNLKAAPENIRSVAYKTLVRPQLEYCTSVWDPHHQNSVYQLEMVQRRAARFTLRRYHQTSSVSNMLTQLGWETLAERRAKFRLINLYKGVHNMIAIDCSHYLTPIQAQTRQSHSMTFRHISTRSDYHKFSFYPRTIPLWNSLPPSIIQSPTIGAFRNQLSKYTIPPPLM